MEAETNNRTRRDPEGTRQRLLEAATAEFAAHGFEGARVERVVVAAGVTTRMLYHYFGDKDGLYMAVLEAAYAELRAGERRLDLDAGAPEEALDRLVRYTFDFFQNNQVFVRLTQGENLLSGRRARRSQSIREMSQPLIDGIERLMERGAASGAFRERADPLQLYISIVALSAHHINNRHTLGAVFGRDLADPEWIAARREHAVKMIMRHVGARSGGL